MKIPDSFRPSAKIKAERLLANVEDEFKDMDSEDDVSLQ